MKLLRLVLAEAALVAVVGAVLAFAANAVSPRGLELGRDYFPGSHSSVRPASGTNNDNAPKLTPEIAPAAGEAAPAQRLAQQGLQLIRGSQVMELHRDPRSAVGGIVFVDARNGEHYAAGHIPGAWQFDHYHADRYLPAVLPVCLRAELVVVYCTGGDCEDSEFAAIMLRDAGVPRERLFVYLGGITEWTTNALPVETGERGGGSSTSPPR